jgi:hypothetical protein
LGKSKTPNPKEACLEFDLFWSFEIVSNFGFRASNFLFFAALRETGFANSSSSEHSKWLHLLHDLGALVVLKTMGAIRAEKRDTLVPQLLPVTIKFSLAFRTGHPENLCHGSS